MIKICIADDHPVVREGLKLTIGKTADLSVAAEASDGPEVLTALRQHPIDLLVLDIAMPIRNGVDLLKQIRQKWPKMPILILTSYPESQYAARAFKLGASGYLTKESATRDLIQAIRTVLSGKRYVSSSFADYLVEQLDHETGRPPHDNLSNRELEVLCLIAAGKSLTNIAKELFLSVKTVSTYRTRILEKLHIQNDAELIRYAIRANLAEA
jgi:two-component system invasion response regulator UvrY